MKVNIDCTLADNQKWPQDCVTPIFKKKGPIKGMELKDINFKAATKIYWFN